VAVGDRLAEARMRAHIDPQGAVEGANAALDATHRFGNHMRRDHGAAS
jgi:hypothetical protein